MFLGRINRQTSDRTSKRLVIKTINGTNVFVRSRCMRIGSHPRPWPQCWTSDQNGLSCVGTYRSTFLHFSGLKSALVSSTSPTTSHHPLPLRPLPNLRYNTYLWNCFNNFAYHNCASSYATSPYGRVGVSMSQ